LSSRLFYLVTCFFVLIVLLFPLIARHQYLIHVALSIFLYAYVASAWNIAGGYGGQLYLCAASFFGMSAYFSSLLLISWNVTPWLGMLASSAIVMVLGGALLYPCFRLKVGLVPLVFVSLAINEAIKILFYNLKQTGGVVGIKLPFYKFSLYYFRFADNTVFYYIFFAMLIMIIFVTRGIEKSRMGYYLKMIRANEDAAQSLGINISRWKLISVLISAFLVGLAGPVYAHYLGFLHPDSLMPSSYSLNWLVMAIVGGLGTLLGPVFGAAILTLVSETTRAVFPLGGPDAIAYGVLMILVVLFYPGGLAKLFGQLLSRVRLRRIQA